MMKILLMFPVIFAGCFVDQHCVNRNDILDMFFGMFSGTEHAVKRRDVDAIFMGKQWQKTRGRKYPNYFHHDSAIFGQQKRR